MSEKYFLGFDVGGTRLKVALINANRKVVRTFHSASNANLGADNLFDTIVEIVEKLQIDFGKNIVGIGLSLSGVVDPNIGVVYLPGKFKMLEGYPLVSKLKTHFNLPVFADNDGRLSAITEKRIGICKNNNWAVILTIGTGIGSGVIIDGKIISNQFLQFGTQIGHFINNSSSSTFCLTKNYGTGETLCSATALALQVKSALQRGIGSSLSDLYFEDPQKIDFEKIAYAVRSGDELCVREMNIWINHLAVLIINSIHAYSPELIVLSGGATLAADIFLEKLERKVNDSVFRYPKNELVPIKVSETQEFAGAIGASLFILSKMENP